MAEMIVESPVSNTGAFCEDSIGEGSSSYNLNPKNSTQNQEALKGGVDAVNVKVEPEDIQYPEEDDDLNESCFGEIIEPDEPEDYCVMCNDINVHPFPKKSQDSVLSVCKLFSLSNRSYKKYLTQSSFCKPCQRKILKLNTTFKKLEELQELINKLRVEFENLVVNSQVQKFDNVRSKILKDLKIKFPMDVSTNLEEPETAIEPKDGDSNNALAVDDIKKEPEDVEEAPEECVFDDEDEPTTYKDDDPDEDYVPTCEDETEDQPRASKRRRRSSSKSKKNSLSPKTPKEKRQNKRSSKPPESKIGEFPCPECGQKSRFKSQFELDIHIEKAHKGNKKPYKCPVEGCPKTFTFPKVLKLHMVSHSNEHSFVCEECGKAFKTERSMKFHQVDMHVEGGRTRQCPHCDKKFSKKQAFEFHLRTHTKEYPYVCDQCGKSYANVTYLHSHIQASHTSEENNPFKCTYEGCGKILQSKHSLELHSCSHTGEYPYKCEICGQGMLKKANLLRHMNVHYGIKPYPCSICDKAFADASSLKQHMMRHQGIKPFSCDTCGKAFIKRDKLERHKKTHSRGAPVPPQPPPSEEMQTFIPNAMLQVEGFVAERLVVKDTLPQF